MTDEPIELARDRMNQTDTPNADKVKFAAEFILENKLNAKDSESARSGAEIQRLAMEEFQEELSRILPSTFIQYLSKAVRDPESRINCLGPRQGYYILGPEEGKRIKSIATDTALSSLEQGTTLNDQENGRSRVRVERERLLYPSLQAWLIAQGYQVKDVSSGRSMGKWGNPDITGISIIDGFGDAPLEITTIEAKSSLEGWEQWIFEAVSHRRFANRSYFAFAHPEESVSKIPTDMRYYAELYRIGVLVLAVPGSVFDKLRNGSTADNQDELQPDAVNILEIYSAPYNHVQPRYQVKYCMKALEIKTRKELYTWGSPE